MFAPIDGTAGPQQPAIDRFDATTWTPLTRPTRSLAEEADWFAHFLLDQQKRATLHIVGLNDKITAVIKSDISPLLQVGGVHRQDLQKLEQLKAWKSNAPILDLHNDEEFSMSLLQLFSEREDVHWADWLQLGHHSFDAYQVKLDRARAERDQAPNERQRQFGDIKVQIMVKKAECFQSFLSISRKLTTPLEEIQAVIRSKIEPAIIRIKRWTLFGQDCLEWASLLAQSKGQNETRELIQQIEERMKRESELVFASTSDYEEFTCPPSSEP
jgi:hypothetical protein